MAQIPRVDFKISDQNNYVFPSVKRGDMVVKMSSDNAGFHVGSITTSSNLYMSANDSIVQFGNAMSFNKGQALFAPGNPSAPSISWSNDKQSGIFRPTLGAVAISSQGSNVAVFSSNITFNTSVAIGKSTPNFDLDIAGTANFSNIFINGQPLSINDPDTSNVAYPMSNVAFPTSNLVFTMSNIAFTTSNAAFTTSNIAFTTSNASFATSNISYSTSNIAYSTSNVAFSASNIAFQIANIANQTISLSNINQAITAIEPANGSSQNVSVPTITTKYVASNAKVTYGRIELGSHSNVSLANSASMTVRVTHNLANTNYMVFPSPEDMTAIEVACSNFTANTMDFIIKNVSGANIVNPSINYQLVQATTSNVTTTL